MTSAYLDSDSEESVASDISEDDLPTYSVTTSTTYKIPKLSTSSPLSSPSGAGQRNKLGGGGHPSVSKEPDTHTQSSPKVTEDRYHQHRHGSDGGGASGGHDHSKSLLSVLKGVSSPGPSPSKLVEEHEQRLVHQNKLTRRVEQLTADIRIKEEKKNKLECYQNGGGIRGLSKKEPTHSTSSEGDVDDGSTSSDLPPHHHHQRLGSIDKSPLPLTPPGFSVLSRPPVFITELSPPRLGEREGVEGGDERGSGPMASLQEDGEILKNMVRRQFFLKFYTPSGSFPTDMWEWLFQIMCLSCDQSVVHGAFYTLKTLVERCVSRTDVFIPSYQDVMLVLDSLGANGGLLREMLGDEKKDGMIQAPPTDSPPTPNDDGPPTPNDDVFSAPPPPARLHLSLLFQYLSLAIPANPSALSCEDTHRFIFLLSILSLDTRLTEDSSTQLPLYQSMSALIQAIPEDIWSTTSLPVLSSKLTRLAGHHHNVTYLCRIITGTSPRLKELQRGICKLAIAKIVFPGDSSLLDHPNWLFAWKVVRHFYQQPAANFEYYSLYSVMYMLSRLIHLSLMDWPSRDKKKEFKIMLGTLASAKIKDHPDKTDRAPVKDLITNMSLDMADQRSKDSTQMDLFTAFRM